MSPLPRRSFLAQTAAWAALPLLAHTAETPDRLIDCNAHLGPHPNRDLPPLTNEALAQRGIDEAWVSSYEGLLHRNMAGVNARHARRCGGRLKPVGIVHPGLPGWQEDLRRCKDEHGFKILRLYPGYHGYTLKEPAFIRLMEQSTAAGLRIQIVVQMEDIRTQHPVMQVKPVDLKPLEALLKSIPEAKVMLLNATATMAQTTLRGMDNVWLDVAMIEGVAGIETLLKHGSRERLVFGTHAPFFYPESSLLKLRESDLDEGVLKAVRHATAEAWLGKN